MSNRHRIRSVSTVLFWACNAYLVAAPLLLIVVWLNFETLRPQWEAVSNLPIQIVYLGFWNKLLGAVISAIPVGLLMYGVWQLRKLFAQFRQGQLFSESGASHLHAFAFMLLLSMLLTPVVGGLLSVVLTMSNPPGERALVLSLGSDNFEQLFLAGTLFAISWILREGCRLREENEAFV